MNDKIDNSVSRQIVESIWNRFDYYLPTIGTGQRGYFVSARLPEEPYKKWVAYINGNPRFRERVREEIESVFSSYVFDSRSYLRIGWSSHGVYFETDGVNGCMVYVESGLDYGYACHNVDTFEQAMVLFIALSLYLRRLYSALESYESGMVSIEKIKPLEKRITEEIKLNKVQGCQMKSEECLYWKTFMCDLCTRNPKSFHILEKRDTDRIGDKWEPPGGLEGRELCNICGANISRPDGKCHVCEE